MFDKEELQIIYEALCYHADGEGHHTDIEFLIGKVLELLEME
jgi:hypothetical protein|tara:strand:+ start:111 stop:236 length:126 start_codon:yes stop_codon:yes gene_type:complete